MKNIRIKDYYGNYQDVPVSDEFYEEWRKLENETQRVYRKEIRHRSAVPLEYSCACVVTSAGSPVEEKIIREESDRELYRAIEQLTPIQKYRVQKLLDGMTLWGLSQESPCSYNALKSSIRYALRKIP